MTANNRAFGSMAIRMLYQVSVCRLRLPCRYFPPKSCWPWLRSALGVLPLLIPNCLNASVCHCPASNTNWDFALAFCSLNFKTIPLPPWNFWLNTRPLDQEEVPCSSNTWSAILPVLGSQRFQLPVLSKESWETTLTSLKNCPVIEGGSSVGVSVAAGSGVSVAVEAGTGVMLGGTAMVAVGIGA